MAEPDAVVPDLPSLFYGAEPVPSLTEGVNMFITPALPGQFDVTPDGKVTEALKFGSTVFVSREFYERLAAQREAALDAYKAKGDSE